jgi:hypothetical protein
MDLKEIWWVDWSPLSQERNQLQALVNTVTKPFGCMKNVGISGVAE